MRRFTKKESEAYEESLNNLFKSTGKILDMDTMSIIDDNIGTYEEECICPYCKTNNPYPWNMREHDHYEIKKCEKCGELFGVKIKTKIVFVYKTNKMSGD